MFPHTHLPANIFGASVAIGAGYDKNRVQDPEIQKAITDMVATSFKYMLDPDNAQKVMEQTLKATPFATGSGYQDMYFQMMSGFKNPSQFDEDYDFTNRQF